MCVYACMLVCVHVCVCVYTRVCVNQSMCDGVIVCVHMCAVIEIRHACLYLERSISVSLYEYSEYAPSYM